MSSKSIALRRSLPDDLASARRRIEGWRAGNGQRRQIPESVWAEAEVLARVHGMHRVSTALRLRYDRLKQRVVGVEARSKAERGGNLDAPIHFVELAPVATADSVSVELKDASGRCMTIRGAGRTEVLSIAATFLGGN